MRMTTREIIGKPVISMADGEKVGDVKDLLIDTSSLAAVTLVVHGNEGNYYISWPRVKSVGADAITIEDKSILDKPEKVVEPIREFRELNGTTVVDGTGTVVGTVRELVLDDDGRIKSIEAKAGGVFGIGTKDSSISAQEVRSIGPRLVTFERCGPA
jgi:sporulation protein YlmC with PRC-barrel domain